MTKVTRSPAEHIMQFFKSDHLPKHLCPTSRRFAALAEEIVKFTPAGPEQTVALRKLLEAKDAAVRSLVAE